MWTWAAYFDLGPVSAKKDSRTAAISGRDTSSMPMSPTATSRSAAFSHRPRCIERSRRRRACIPDLFCPWRRCQPNGPTVSMISWTALMTPMKSAHALSASAMFPLLVLRVRLLCDGNCHHLLTLTSLAARFLVPNGVKVVG